jgi:hypothetical protein
MVKRVAKRLLICLAVIAALMGVLNSNYLKKPPSYPHFLAADIASGVLLAEEGYDFQKTKARLTAGRPCDDPYHRSPPGEAPYWTCLQVFPNNYEGCGIWSTEHSCVSLLASPNLLNEPERLGRIIDSLYRPCKYLPEPGTDAFVNLKKDDQKMFGWGWRKLDCDVSRDSFRGNVILVLKDNDNRVVVKITKPQLD